MPQSQMLKEQVEAIGETSLDASAPVTKAPEYGGHTTQLTAVITGPILADGVLAPHSRRTMRILLVEDEAPIADFISRGLTEHGYSVDIAHDGEEAVDWPSVADFAVIVLDVMLPVRDGIEACRILRQRGLRSPILMLTARDAIEDRVLGLDSGADDYLVKPFAFEELLARLRALSRREPVLTCGGSKFIRSAG